MSFPTWKPCPTTDSRTPRYHFCPARHTGRAARPAKVWWWPWTRCCSAWRRALRRGYSLKVHVGETLDLKALRARLALQVMAAVTQVVAHGEFACVFADRRLSDGRTPRIESTVDRDVDSIRRFDPDTQRSLDKLDRISCCRRAKRRSIPTPVREFRRRYRVRFTASGEQAIYRDVSAGIAPAESNSSLPCSSTRTSTFRGICRRTASSWTSTDAASRWMLCGTHRRTS